MEGQLTIFDLLEERTLEDMTEEEMITEVERRLGLRFQVKEYKGTPPLYEYEYKFNKDVRITCEYDTYMGTSTRFISVGYDNKKSKGGGGAPCDSIEEAVEYFKRIIKREVEGYGLGRRSA